MYVFRSCQIHAFPENKERNLWLRFFSDEMLELSICTYIFM